MEEDGERDRKHREMCSAVLELLSFEEASAETYLTHAFFSNTIREKRLAGVSLERVTNQQQAVYPIWMIQSRLSVIRLLGGPTHAIDDIDALVSRARESSPRLEACAFLLEDAFRRFLQTVKAGTHTQCSSSLVTSSEPHRGIWGCIYPDRAFTIIRLSQRPIQVTTEDIEEPPKRPQALS